MNQIAYARDLNQDPLELQLLKNASAEPLIQGYLEPLPPEGKTLHTVLSSGTAKPHIPYAKLERSIK
jgi:hypothetical protein